ncbi:MAG: PTS sugar transporter subunit IIB [Enterococcus avium]
MIKLFRIDHRLLHGQVAYSWTNALNANAILIASDKVVNDVIRKEALKLAKPSGAKLVIKSIDDAIDAINSGVTDKYNLLIVVENIDDASKLAKKAHGVTSLNLGGIKKGDRTEQISKAIHLLPEEKKSLINLMDDGLEIEIRQVPGDKKKVLSKSDLS